MNFFPLFIYYFILPWIDLTLTHARVLFFILLLLFFFTSYNSKTCWCGNRNSKVDWVYFLYPSDPWCWKWDATSSVNFFFLSGDVIEWNKTLQNKTQNWEFSTNHVLIILQQVHKNCGGIQDKRCSLEVPGWSRNIFQTCEIVTSRYPDLLWYFFAKLIQSTLCVSFISFLLHCIHNLNVHTFLILILIPVKMKRKWPIL